MKSIHDSRYVSMIKRLKRLRKERNVSQVVLAERLQWKQQDISRVESFVRRLDVIELYDWLKAMGIKVEDFLREVEQGWLKK